MNPQPPAAPRCEVCGWPLADSVERGCVAGNCSMRPVPKKPHSLPPLDKETGEAVWRICEPNRPLPQAQSTAAPITSEEIAALRDALAKATPGPAIYDADSCHVECDGAVVARILQPDDFPCFDDDELGVDDRGKTLQRECTANGELFALSRNIAPKLLAALDQSRAAAPDLLTACEKAEQWFRDKGYSTSAVTAEAELLGMLRAAIAAAKQAPFLI